MWELDQKEGSAPKNWCSGTLVLEKRLPWTARSSNQSILKEISLEYSLEGLMLKLKLKFQHFGHLMQRTDSLEKTLMLGKTFWRQEEKGMTEEEMVEWHHWLDGYEFEQTPGDSEGREAWHAAVHGVSESETIEQLNNNWKDLPWGTRLVILGSVLWGQDHQGANLPSKGESSGNSKNTVHWEFWSILASSSPKPLLSFHTLPESSGIGTHLMGANTFPSI